MAVPWKSQSVSLSHPETCVSHFRKANKKSSRMGILIQEPREDPCVMDEKVSEQTLQINDPHVSLLPVPGAG